MAGARTIGSASTLQAIGPWAWISCIRSSTLSPMPTPITPYSLIVALGYADSAVQGLLKVAQFRAMLSGAQVVPCCTATEPQKPSVVAPSAYGLPGLQETYGLTCEEQVERDRSVSVRERV